MPKKSRVPLIGFFDESESPLGQKPIAVAGFLFTRPGYANFYREWKRTVLQHGSGVRHFYMTDLMLEGGYIPVSRFPKTRRDLRERNHRYKQEYLRLDRRLL